MGNFTITNARGAISLKLSVPTAESASKRPRAYVHVFDVTKGKAMKASLNRTLPGALGAGILLSAAHLAGAALTDYAKPMIGTAEHGHVFPGATVPFGMVQVSPDTRDGSADDAYQDGSAGYHYSDSSIMGLFPQSPDGDRHRRPGQRAADADRGRSETGRRQQARAGLPGHGFLTEQEEARPGYYRVFLPDYKINVELTATARVGVHRYTFPGGHGRPCHS